MLFQRLYMHTPHGPFSCFHKTTQVPTTWTILQFPQNHASAYYMDNSPVFTETTQVPTIWTILVSTETMQVDHFPISTKNMQVPTTQNIFLFPQKPCMRLSHRTSCFHRNHACAYHTEHSVCPCFISFTLSCFKDCTHTHTHRETMHVSTKQNIFLLVLAQVNSHHLCQFCCFHDSAHAHTQKTSIIHSSFSSPLLF